MGTPQRIINLILATAVIAACQTTDGPAPDVVAPTASVWTGTVEVQEEWGLCAACHGATGLGDGVAAASLGVDIQSFDDPVWQEATSDEFLRAVIIDGGRAHGMSAMMPSAPKLKNQPEVLDDLVRQIRALCESGE